MVGRERFKNECEQLREKKKQLMRNSGDERRCKHAFDIAEKQCEEKNIFMTDTQQLSLLSHISSMVHRSLSGEKLVSFDRGIFSSISSDSLTIAQSVKDLLDGLEDDEVYLLSIHFEVAKNNVE